VNLIPAQHVKPFVRGNKNDYNDALAIAEAVTRPEMHLVAIKTRQQQDIQALHRLRARRLHDRTALCNQLRGLLGEYGIVFSRGVNVVRKRIPEILEDSENGLSDLFRSLLSQGYQQLTELDAHIDAYTEALDAHSKRDDACQRLQTIPGYGPIISSAFYSAVGILST
jgi:transposase